MDWTYIGWATMILTLALAAYLVWPRPASPWAEDDGYVPTFVRDEGIEE
jgi:hypothetical protein